MATQLRAAKIDFSSVLPEHRITHERLLNWAAWARHRPGSGPKLSSIYKLYKPRIMESPPDTARSEIDVLDAIQMERRIVALSPRERRIIVWWYLAKWTPARAAREIGTNYSEMEKIIHQARSALTFFKKIHL